METGPLYNPTMKQTNLRAGCKSTLQPGTMTDRLSQTFEDPYIFSLPRISTREFPYIKEKIVWSIGINYCFVTSRLIAEVNDFFKIGVTLDKSKPTRVALIWLRVTLNRTRLFRAAHFARYEIKYQKRRESGLFQYNLYVCTIACLSFIPRYKQEFYKCYSLSPS